MRRASLIGFFSVVGLALAACQLVAGIESRPTDPLVAGCALPTEGSGRVRVANLVPSDQAVDVCVRPLNGDFKRPVLRGGGSECPAGFKYTDVSAPFASQTGRIVVKMIPAGLTCAASALAEGTLDVPEGAVLTIARIGGNGKPEAVVGIPESKTTDVENLRLRFVNALPTDAPLRLGLVKEARLPTQLDAPILDVVVPFGGATPTTARSALGKVDDHGYLVTQPTAFNVGAAEDGSSKAILVATIPRAPSTYSLFAIGNPNELAFSPRGLFCSEGTVNGILATCTLTALPTLSVDTFDVGLYGPNAVFEAQRRPKIFEAITARDTDIACLMEAARKEDRDALVGAGVAGQLKFSQTAETTLDTPATDPRDQAGNTPPAPTTPPCGGTVPAKEVDDAFNCVVKNCSSKPGDASGVLAGSTDCISTNCASEFIPLLGGTRDQQACFDCILVNINSQASFSQTKLTCTTDTRQALGFAGQTPSLVLSRYPLLNQETFVLPSTGFRRSVLYSQVQLQQGATVDFYCAHLTSTLISTSLPYVGNYSGGDVSQGWQNEQILQAQKIVAYIKQKSGNRPAIIAGDWHSSIAFPAGGADAGVVKTIDDLNPETLRILRSAFAEAKPRDATPQCTYCPKALNPYNGEFTGVFLTPTFLSNFAADATASREIIFNQPVVPIPSGTGMLSEYFGMNVRILRP